MNILFLTHRLPYAPNRGDRVRAFHLLRHLARWANVHLVSLVHDDEEVSHVKEIDKSLAESITVGRVTHLGNRARAALALATPVPTTHTMLRAPGLADQIASVASRARPDVVICYCTGVGPLTATPSLAGVPLVLDMVDVDSKKWAALAQKASPPLSWIYRREARTLSRYEAEIARRAHCTTVVTPRESNALQKLAPGARIEVVPNGVDTEPLSRPPRDRRPSDVVFCGVMNYQPNVDAVVWFAEQVWPGIRARKPEATFTVAGSDPDRRVRQLAALPGVEITGAVDDVRPYLWRATLSVAPLHTARGVQNKVLEAIAAGLPAVVTPVVAAGLPQEVHSACSVAETAETFAAKVLELLSADQAERDALVARADLGALSWERSLAKFRTIVKEAAAR